MSSSDRHPRSSFENRQSGPARQDSIQVTRKLSLFRQADVTRALKGAKSAGLEVERVEIGEKIVIWARESAAPDVDPIAVWEATRANKT